MQAVAAALSQASGQLPPLLFRLPPSSGAGSDSQLQQQLLGQAEWEAAFDQAALDCTALPDLASRLCRSCILNRADASVVAFAAQHSRVCRCNVLEHRVLKPQPSTTFNPAIAVQAAQLLGEAEDQSSLAALLHELGIALPQPPQASIVQTILQPAVTTYSDCCWVVGRLGCACGETGLCWQALHIPLNRLRT